VCVLSVCMCVLVMCVCVCWGVSVNMGECVGRVQCVCIESVQDSYFLFI
jgi:hypothetical protein